MRVPMLTALVLASFVASARADVLVVDGVAAAGHFATIQAAVDAAAVGDTILVDVTYDTTAQSVVIDGKGLSLLVDTPETTHVIKKLSIRNVPAGQRVSVEGLIVSDPGGVALECLDNAGELRFYDVGVQGQQGAPLTATQIARPGSTGAIFTNCADVVARDCGFGGGDGGDVYGVSVLATSDGGTGAIVTNSKLACFFTQFLGGDGGNVKPIDSTAAGGAGGTGLQSVDSTLFISGYLGTGGAGGDTTVAVGGPGGTGMVQSGASVELLTYNAPVYGGAGGNSSFEADGPDGTAQVILDGSTTELSVPLAAARDIWTTTPVREGEPVSITGIGFNDDFWVAMSLDAGHLLLPKYKGVLTLGAPFLIDLQFLGHVPFLAVTFPLGTVPELPAGFESLEIHVQAVVKSSGGSFTLAAPNHFVLLDAAF